MEILLLLVFVIIIVIVVIGAGITILKSIKCGIRMLRQTYTVAAPNPTARRLLAWNLIEPGLTIPNIVVWYILLLQGFLPDILSWIQHDQLRMELMWMVLGLWPMILLFVIIPLFAQGSADPIVRWATRKTAKLGILRMVITIFCYSTYGIGMVVGVPYLLWSIKKIRLWNAELLGQAAGSWEAAAIVGGEGGTLVLSTQQIQQTTNTSDFKAFID